MIHARGLVQVFHTGKGKKKREVRAVDGVDLDIAEGEVVGFLGPNGAGKTTTLRMLTTLLRPTAGTATVNGFDVVADPVSVRRSIGYVSQAGGTFSQAQAGDEIVDHGMLYGLSRAEATRRGHDLFSQLQLDGLWERQPKNMSGGQKRRLDIVMGLVHEPSLVFLDEPTTGPTRRRARTCGTTSGAFAPSVAQRSSSRPTTSTRQTSCPTGSSSSTTAASSRRTPPTT